MQYDEYSSHASSRLYIFTARRAIWRILREQLITLCIPTLIVSCTPCPIASNHTSRQTDA